MYLYEVSWLMPTGPLGGILLVDIPTSPPKPDDAADALAIALTGLYLK